MKKVGIGASWNTPNNRPASRITTGTPRSICTSSTTAKTTATATRIQKVAGNRSRWSSARFRHTSVITLVTDMAAASSSPMGAKPRVSMDRLLLRHQLHRPQHARRQRPHALHILSLEFFAVFGGQFLVVRQWSLVQHVEREIGHHHANRVLARFQQAGHLDFKRRFPHRSRRLPVDEYLRR